MTDRMLQYEAIEPLSRDAVDVAVARDDASALVTAVLAVALYSDDLPWAEGLCLRLAGHRDATVRGNALLGLGHLARRHRRLDRARAQPALEAGLRDASAYVRGQTESAVDDVEHFLSWRVRRPEVT